MGVSLSIALMMKRFMPTGGVIKPMLRQTLSLNFRRGFWVNDQAGSVDHLVYIWQRHHIQFRHGVGVFAAQLKRRYTLQPWRWVKVVTADHGVI